jgi:hypothetical protein
VGVVWAASSVLLYLLVPQFGWLGVFVAALVLAIWLAAAFGRNSRRDAWMDVFALALTAATLPMGLQVLDVALTSAYGPNTDLEILGEAAHRAVSGFGALLSAQLLAAIMLGTVAGYVGGHLISPRRA